MDKLTREELERISKLLQRGDDIAYTKDELVDSNLALYDRVEKLENDLLTAHDDGVDSGMEALKAKVRELIKHYKALEAEKIKESKIDVADYQHGIDAQRYRHIHEALSAILGEGGGG